MKKLESLPTEILVAIFTELTYCDIKRLQRVCKRFNSITTDAVPEFDRILFRDELEPRFRREFLPDISTVVGEASTISTISVHPVFAAINYDLSPDISGCTLKLNSNVPVPFADTQMAKENAVSPALNCTRLHVLLGSPSHQRWTGITGRPGKAVTVLDVMEVVCYFLKGDLNIFGPRFSEFASSRDDQQRNGGDHDSKWGWTGINWVEVGGGRVHLYVDLELKKKQQQ